MFEGIELLNSNVDQNWAAAVDAWNRTGGESRSRILQILADGSGDRMVEAMAESEKLRKVFRFLVWTAIGEVILRLGGRLKQDLEEVNNEIADGTDSDIDSDMGKDMGKEKDG